MHIVDFSGRHFLVHNNGDSTPSPTRAQLW